MARVYIGIGSNIEPERHIRAGLAKLGQWFKPLLGSTAYANRVVDLIGWDITPVAIQSPSP